MGATLILLLFLVPAAEALTARDLVVAESSDFSPATSLTSGQVTEDIQYLRFAVAHSYAGPPELSQGLAAFASSAVDSVSLCAELGRLLARVRDRHLQSYLLFKNCATGSDPGRVGENAYGGEQPWNLQYRNVGARAVAVLSLARMADKDDPQWNGFLPAVARLRQQNQAFVIDLRGDSGGDDDQGFELARILYGLGRAQTLPSPLASMTYVQGAESFALQLNAWTYQIMELERENRGVPPLYRERQQEWRQWLHQALHRHFPHLRRLPIVAESPDPRSIFTKNVYVLVDRGCASACETTLQALEALPGRILVGENSRGAVEFGTVGMLRLPHSHILVQLATESVQFRDRRHPESVGYAPDLRVPEGGDALSRALEQIAQLP